MRARFGDLGIVLAPHAFRHARRRGWLLLLEERDEPRSGAVLVPHGEELRILAFGATGDTAAARTGVEALGTARPVLTDGVLRYKRKWGACLGAPDTLDRFVPLHRNTPAVREVLTATPLVVERADGGLAGLVGARGVDVEAQLARVDVPGLRELVLLAEPDVDLVRPLTAPHSPLAVVPPSDR